MWSIGILMAGSLYWSTEPYRVTWRGKFLDMNRVILVRAPIRYGRKSRHGTYTMVYAPGSPMGQAKVVACQKHAMSGADILTQAQALWLAERPSGARPVPGQLHSASWGCVAILFPPNGDIPSSMIDEWAQHADLLLDVRYSMQVLTASGARWNFGSPGHKGASRSDADRNRG
jgi:hypothetical protein